MSAAACIPSSLARSVAPALRNECGEISRPSRPALRRIPRNVLRTLKGVSGVPTRVKNSRCSASSGSSRAKQGQAGPSRAKRSRITSTANRGIAITRFDSWVFGCRCCRCTPAPAWTTIVPQTVTRGGSVAPLNGGRAQHVTHDRHTARDRDDIWTSTRARSPQPATHTVTR